jgi:uncharacterized protein (TIGR03437 family)
MLNGQIPGIGKGFILPPAGSITGDPRDVISGSKSIKGSYSGAATFSPFLYTDPAIIHLLPNSAYKLTFRYRIVTAPSKSFGAMFYSSRAGSAGDFLPGIDITGQPGATGTVMLTSTLRNYPDYEVYWSIHDTGTIVIDDIQVTDGAGRIVVTENGEGPAIQPGAASFRVTDWLNVPFGAAGQTNLIRSVAAKDLDGDGRDELILTFTTYPDQLWQPVLVAGTAAKLSLKTDSIFPGGAPAVKHSPHIMFADINGDGIEDLLFADSGLDHPPWTGTGFAAALALGKGAFRDISALIPADLQDAKAYTLAAADLDGDGKAEIILPDTYFGVKTAELRWNGSGFDAQRNWIDSQLWGPPTKLVNQEQLEISDIDADGWPDLVIGGQNWMPNTSLLFGGASGFTAPNLLQLPDGPFGHTSFETYSSPAGKVAEGANVEHIVIADFNNDGLPDLFELQEQVIVYQPGAITNKVCAQYLEILANGGTCSEEGDYALQVFLNRGSRRFLDYSSASSKQRLGRRLYLAAFPVDVNNDGFMDVVAIYYTKPYGDQPGFQAGTTFFLNDGTGAFDVVEGEELLPAFTISGAASSPRWEMGAFVPTLVTPTRIEGVSMQSISPCSATACPGGALTLYKLESDQPIGTGPGFIDPATAGAPGFNEFYYLRAHPDVAAGVQSGQYRSGLEHYLAVGRAKGYVPNAKRQPITVVSAADQQATIASGEFVSIFGTGFSSTTRTWMAADFAGGGLPTSLDGVSVTINGKDAYVEFVSPTQINVIAPDDDVAGGVLVQVTTPNGGFTGSALKRGAAPALFNYRSAGLIYAAAVHLDGALVGPAGPGARPAIPGEVIEIFGTGFGATAPALPAGQLVAQPSKLASPVTLNIGGAIVPAQWAGLVSSGLNQINVQIPEIPEGDQRIQIVGAESSSTSLFLPIRGK